MDKVLSPGSRRNSFSKGKNMSIDEDEDNDINKDADVNEVGKRCNETNLSDDKNCRQYVRHQKNPTNNTACNTRLNL